MTTRSQPRPSGRHGLGCYVHDLPRRLAGRISGPSGPVNAMRGAAVALREYGWAIDLDVARLAGDPGSGPLRRHVRSMHIGDLRRFRDPLTAGVGVLANLELAPPTRPRPVMRRGWSATTAGRAPMPGSSPW